MTPNEINEAIMLSLGYQKEIYKRVPDSDLDERYQPHDGAVTWRTRDGKYLQRQPNYPFDLNDCAEFEASLGSEDKVGTYEYWNNGKAAYVVQLHKDITGRGFLEDDYDIRYDAICMATAPQRCEAYLKVKGLWK